MCFGEKLTPIEAEIFDFLESMLEQNVLKAVEFIDKLLKKNLKDDDYYKLESLKLFKNNLI
jgi:hypothetical protein